MVWWRISKRKSQTGRDEQTELRLIVGLGNPGTRYLGTRHNMGFEVIDLLAEALGVDVAKKKFGARFGEAQYAGKRLILLKPWQFMNRSGQAVATAMGFYKLPLQNLLVVVDDMALVPGAIRLRARGSAGGHNGLADIIQKLGTDEFARCRVGIGAGGNRDAYDYVLDRPAAGERALLDEAAAKAREAAFCWIESGIEKAMNQFNRAYEARE